MTRSNSLLATIGMRVPRPIHPFPARMAASIALEELQSKNKRLRVLDPMAGSGTTLAVAKLHGHEGIGFDIDPLSVVLAKAWCTEFSPDRLRSAARGVLQSAMLADQRMKLRNAYPCPASDSSTRKYVRYWFNPVNRRQLTCLSRSIHKEMDTGIQNLLWCAFSRLIVRKDASVSLARDVSHGKPHRVRSFSEVGPFNEFMKSVEGIIRAAPFPKMGTFGSVSVHAGDARCLPLESESVDIVITSPPYLNAIEYLRGHKLTLVWMGHSIDRIYSLKKRSVGTDAYAHLREETTEEPLVRKIIDGPLDSLQSRQRRMLGRYVSDLDAVVSEIARVLKHGSCAIFVVGNSNIRNVFVRNSAAVSRLARRHGLRPVSEYSRTLPEARRYLPPPSNGTRTIDKRMREEVVLKFRKPN